MLMAVWVVTSAASFRGNVVGGRVMPGLVFDLGRGPPLLLDAGAPGAPLVDLPVDTANTLLQLLSLHAHTISSKRARRRLPLSGCPPTVEAYLRGTTPRGTTPQKTKTRKT